MARTVLDYRMASQIRSQAAEIERILGTREPVHAAAEVFGKATRVFTVGTGTSTNAARTAVYMLRAAGVNAVEWAAHDFVSYPPQFSPGDAALVFSHSGRKRFSREALQLCLRHGLPTVWIAGTEAEHEDGAILLRTVARETSAAFTVSHTAAMAMSARVADAISEGAVGKLDELPGAVQQAVDTEEAVETLAEDWHGFGALFAVGGGPHEVSAHEVAIKVNEAARLRARGYATEQFLHGPQAQMQTGDPLLVFAGEGAALERSRTVAQFALDIGAPVGWIGPLPGPEGVRWIAVAGVSEQLAPIVEIVPGQWLACYLAALEGVDADNFRRDDPPFAAAYERYQL